MNRKEAAELFPIIKAFSEGKIIQTSIKGRSWEDLSENIVFYTNDKYRIKPEPKYRYFKNAEECWQEMLKHQPFGWVKTKDNTYRSISLVGENSIMLGCQNIDWDYERLFKDFKFYDDTPFGVKVEE